MAGIFRMAWRNLGRNRRRSLTTGSALAFGISLCVATYGLTDGLNAQLVDALTRLELGHVQIHQRDFAKRQKLEHALKDAATMAELAAEQPGVRAVALRAYANALVSGANKSSGAELVGVEPAREPEVTTLHRHLVDGRYLDDEPTPWPKGRALTAAERAADQALSQAQEEAILDEIEGLSTLESAPPATASDAPPTSSANATASPPTVEPTAPQSEAPRAPTGEQAAELSRRLALALAPPPERPPGVFIGAGLAKVLEVGVDDELYLTAQTADGLSESVFARVRGIFETGTQGYDRYRVYLHLADLQRLVHLDGRSHEIALSLAEPDEAGAVAARLTSTLGASERDAVVRSWRQIRPDIAQMLELNSVSTGLMVLIIFIVATLGVVNTMLMAVFERTRELGVLKAIGMSGGKILRLIITETLLLVLAASAAGTLIGLAMDLYMVRYGVDLSFLTGGISFGGIGVKPILYGEITAAGLLQPTLILATTSFVASFYPALRAARMQPAVGMRET